MLVELRTNYAEDEDVEIHARYALVFSFPIRFEILFLIFSSIVSARSITEGMAESTRHLDNRWLCAGN